MHKQHIFLFVKSSFVKLETIRQAVLHPMVSGLLHQQSFWLCTSKNQDGHTFPVMDQDTLNALRLVEMVQIYLPKNLNQHCW